MKLSVRKKVSQFWIENKELIVKAFRMSWPAVVESFFVAFVGMVDSMMVSKLGTYAVAAVGLTTQPKFVAWSIFISTNVAVSALVARRKGEEDREDANRVLMSALVFVLIAGVIVSALCVIFANPIIAFMGSESDTHDSAVLYYRIIMAGSLFNLISLTINAAQRGSGNTKISMRTNLTSNLVNVIGNYLLINGNLGFPALGIKGAAIATVFGTVIACGMSIYSLLEKDSYVQFVWAVKQKLKPAWQNGKQIAKLAINIFIEQICIRVGFVTVTMMAANLGTENYAVHLVGMNVMSMSFAFGDGMQAAAVSLIGQSLGQKRPDLAQKYGTICQRMGNIISVILSVLYLLCGRWFFGLYFEEQDLIGLGVQIMSLMVVIVLMQIAQVIYMGCLRGAGDVRFTTIASTFSITFIRPLTSWLFAYALSFGILGIWFGVICDQVCRLLLTSWRFRSGKWTKVKI